MAGETDTSPKSDLTAFVAMSYDGRLQPVYLKVIEPVLRGFGYTCTRADEETRMGMVIDQIRESINTADLIFCDLTFQNPNVYYELGIAHTLGKNPILISQDPSIPFDAKHLRVILYEDSKYGLLDFREKLVDCIQKASARRPRPVSRAHARNDPDTADELRDQRVALFSNSGDMKRWAIKFLGDHRDAQSFERIEQIATSLEALETDFKRDAFTALYNIDRERARSILLEHGLRYQRDFLVRERVVDLLGNYPPDNELIFQMLQQATDSSWGVRRTVCEVLGRWKDPRAVNQLRMMLSDSEPQVSMAAVGALGRFSERQLGGDIKEVRQQAKEALERIDDDGTKR